VRTYYYPNKEIHHPRHFLTFEACLLREREGFRPDIDPLRKRELFHIREDSPTYSCTTSEGGTVTRQFCDHHDSELFSPTILDFWVRRRHVVSKISQALSTFETPRTLTIFKLDLDEVVEVMEKNFLNVWNCHYRGAMTNHEWEKHLQMQPARTSCPACQVSWFCSHIGWGILEVITVAAALFGDIGLQAWLTEVFQARYSRTVWTCKEQGYVSPFNLFVCDDIWQATDYYIKIISQVALCLHLEGLTLGERAQIVSPPNR
jgi:hypothetical protein